jgi:hypothetical protein
VKATNFSEEYTIFEGSGIWAKKIIVALCHKGTGGDYTPEKAEDQHTQYCDNCILHNMSKNALFCASSEKQYSEFRLVAGRDILKEE